MDCYNNGQDERMYWCSKKPLYEQAKSCCWKKLALRVNCWIAFYPWYLPSSVVFCARNRSWWLDTVPSCWWKRKKALLLFDAAFSEVVKECLIWLEMWLSKSGVYSGYFQCKGFREGEQIICCLQTHKTLSWTNRPRFFPVHLFQVWTDIYCFLV